MKQVRLSDDERLITLTKKAYDDLNNRVEELELEMKNNTIRLFTSHERQYHYRDYRWWRRIDVDARFPDSIKRYVSDFMDECISIKDYIHGKLDDAEKLAATLKIRSVNLKSGSVSKNLFRNGYSDCTESNDQPHPSLTEHQKVPHG